MRKIYDCFCFFNEFDILELRLNILDPVVDYFVLCESDRTHSGQEKPFYFEENKERFAKFLPKIIHLKITDSPDNFEELPEIDLPVTFDDVCLMDIFNFMKVTNTFNRSTEPHYGRDFFQKECIRRGLKNCHDDDIIISSDCDEIPDPEVLMSLQSFFNPEQFYSFRQNSYYYYLNMLQQPDWYGSRMGTYGKLKHYSYNELRKQQNNVIYNGGWHFSFMGGTEKVKQKIQSYSHVDMNTADIIGSIEKNMQEDNDPFFRGKLMKVEIGQTFPKYLLENPGKYAHMIKP